MPVTFERAFHVRHYECDYFGHLNNVNYVRYMQEAAFEASSAVGYDMARYDAIGYHWLVHETDIEYLQPVRYGDAITIKTWVVDARRVRSRRAYELRNAASGEMIARAFTDWVFLESATGRPASIPKEIGDAFLPDGPEPNAPPIERFPNAPTPPPGAFKWTRRAGWRDVDPAQHVNNAAYLGYAEDCRVDASSAHRWPMQRLVENNVAIVTRRHRIEYQQPALLGDELELTMWFANPRRATIDLHYTITRLADHAPIARIYTLLVCIDFNTGKPMRFPNELMQDFAPMSVGYG